MWIRLGRFGVFPLLLVVVAAAGCRETEPPPDYDRDLAENDEPLMLPGAEWKDSTTASGSAEWVPFRRPTIGAPERPKPPGEPESPEAETAPDGASPVEAEVRGAVEDYNAAVADATAEELLDYFVEAQHDAVEPWLASAVTLTDRLTQVCEALETSLPDATDRVMHVCEALRVTHSPKLSIESVKVSSDAEASGTVKWFGERKACRFASVEDEDGETAWFFELQGLAPYTEKKPTLDAMGIVYERLLQAIESGQPLTEAALNDLEQLAPPPATESDKKGAKPAEPEPDPAEAEPDAVGEEP